MATVIFFAPQNDEPVRMPWKAKKRRKAEIQKQRQQQIFTLHITFKSAARGNTKQLPKNHSAGTNLSMGNELPVLVNLE